MDKSIKPVIYGVPYINLTKENEVDNNPYFQGNINICSESPVDLFQKTPSLDVKKISRRHSIEG